MSNIFFDNLNKQSEPKRTIIFYGEVVDNNDPIEGFRLKCRIRGLDDKTRNEDLPFATPLLPRHLNILPKVGETVKIFIPDDDIRNREWIGPVINQLQNIDQQNYFISGFGGKSFENIEPNTPISQIPEMDGVFPDKETVALLGRGSTDIQLKKDSIVIRAGKYSSDIVVNEFNKNIALNRKNPIQIELSWSEENSNTNIISDTINLISHGGNPKVSFDGRDLDIDKLHPLPYGDVLLEFLTLIKQYTLTHIHSGSRLEANIGSGQLEKIKNFDLSRILGNKKIRIN
jgi:hypothetical protein